MDHDRREAERSPASIKAAVKTDGNQHPCRLKNISVTGAQVTLDATLKEGTVLSLVISPYAPINGTVMWQQAKAVGIRFNDDVHAIEEVLLGLSALPSAY